MKLSHGFRSRFEFEFAQYLAKSKIKYKYEKDKFRYIVPIKSYTPDFYLMDYGFYLELKGNLDVTDRVKHLLVKEQNSSLDVRFIFPNSKKKIYKGSKTTYAAWCDRHGFLYADDRIPDIWLK
jgi:hypothetical protein|tara:strand:+ start:104 stop:472 length:369 start_codon:yes stop_codon:yes gene_type:complete